MKTNTPKIHFSFLLGSHPQAATPRPETFDHFDGQFTNRSFPLQKVRNSNMFTVLIT